MILYCAINTLTGKRYIGLTTMSLQARWNAHVSFAMRGNKTALANSIRKHGPEAFQIEEVATLLPGLGIEDLKAMEVELIAQEGTMVPHGYNMTAGGDGTIGYRYTDEQRATVTGRKHTAVTRAKMSAARTGARHTPEAKAKIGAAKLGFKWDHPSACKGRPLTPEHRAKLSAAKLAFWAAKREQQELH